ncbi:MAG: cobalt-precorrin-6A reductase [Alphaproteobacteria bacterium]|nr:cobalt-precorrin-6A reductase [Alphaproteobacteria bacterium]
MTEGRILILGGTALAVALARAVAELQVPAVYSLAGRTKAKPLPGMEMRGAGFGGTGALADYLEAEKVLAVIDASHAYAQQISANAEAACEAANLPLLRLESPPWRQVDGDHWVHVPDIAAAKDAAANLAKRVFVSTGRQAMAEFAEDDRCWWLARVIAPGDDLPALANGRYLFARGPFALTDELNLLGIHEIGAVISKNAGNAASHAKILAARERKLPVIMIERPNGGAAPRVDTVEAAMAWLQICLV